MAKKKSKFEDSQTIEETIIKEHKKEFKESQEQAKKNVFNLDDIEQISKQEDIIIEKDKTKISIKLIKYKDKEYLDIRNMYKKDGDKEWKFGKGVWLKNSKNLGSDLVSSLKRIYKLK